MTDNQIDISNQVISMDKEYVTRKGDVVRILCTDNYSNPEYPVVAIVADGEIRSFAKNGKYVNCTEPNNYDLIDIWTYEKSQFKEGDILIVGVYEDQMHFMRVFSHFDDDGYCYCFLDGMRSGMLSTWEYCRKATEEEIAKALLAFTL